MFFNKRYPRYGEGGLYEGVQEAVTSKIYGRQGCRIHISQADYQSVKIDIMNGERIVDKMEVKGDKWIRINGEGYYWIKAYNNEAKSLRVGLSLREIK